MSQNIPDTTVSPQDRTTISDHFAQYVNTVQNEVRFWVDENNVEGFTCRVEVVFVDGSEMSFNVPGRIPPRGGLHD